MCQEPLIPTVRVILGGLVVSVETQEFSMGQEPVLSAVGVVLGDLVVFVGT